MRKDGRKACFPSSAVKGSMQRTQMWQSAASLATGHPTLAAEQEAGFDTRSSLFTVAERVKNENPADLSDLLSSSWFCRECSVGFGGIYEAGGFNFTFKDCKAFKSMVNSGYKPF